MRCIETVLYLQGRAEWTDKLQHEMYWNTFDTYLPSNTFLINYNMRCIETCNVRQEQLTDDSINYNMRCIETRDET